MCNTVTGEAAVCESKTRERSAVCPGWSGQGSACNLELSGLRGPHREGARAEDEMVEWHHRLYEHEFEQGLGDGGQGNLVVLQSMGLQRVGHD